MTKSERRIRLIGICICQLFTLFTIAYLVSTAQYSRLTMALGTIIMILLPEIMERLFRCKISLPLYIFVLFYAIGPMLGHCWNLYYIGIGWDKLLHTSGGIVFALIGLYLFDFLSKGENPVLLRAIFALCFSIALSVIWEFVEYGADVFLHTDMQQDTLVNSVHTYFLGDGLGIVGSLENILSVVVDDVVLSTEGYVDIGLIDTMEDMLVETMGALLVSLWHLVDGNKHPLIRPVRQAAA